MTTTRRRDILDQALELVIENGLGELTMAKVAGRVGFTEPAMYRHFQNKQDLVINMIRRLGEGFEEVFRHFDLEDPPQRFFPAYFDALLDYLRQVRGVTFLFLSESAFNSDQQIRGELWQLFQGQLGRFITYLEGAIARGEIRPGVEAEAAALCFLGVVQALVTRSLLTSWDEAPQAVGRGALDIFVKGVVG